MPISINPATKNLMLDPFGSMFPYSPQWVRSAANAVIPSGEVPYSFGAVKIPTGPIPKIIVNTRKVPSSTSGLFFRDSNEIVMRKQIDVIRMMETLLHELAHWVSPVRGHGKEFTEALFDKSVIKLRDKVWVDFIKTLDRMPKSWSKSSGK